MKSRKYEILVFFVALLASMLSIALFLHLTPTDHIYPVTGSDPSYYLQYAKNILRGDAHFDTSSVPWHWSVGYPLFLAVSLLLGSVWYAVGTQVVLFAISAVFIFRMALTYVDEWFAVLAGLLFALDPILLATNTVVLSDGLFSSLLVIVVYLLFFGKRSMTTYVFAGIMWGFAILVRPVGEYLAVILPIYCLLIDHSKKSVVGALLFFFCSISIVIPAVVRNDLVLGEPTISDTGNWNLLYRDVQGFLGHPVSASIPDTQWGEVATSYMEKQPVQYAAYHIVNTIPFFWLSGIRYYQLQVQSYEAAQGLFVPAHNPVPVSLLEVLLQALFMGVVATATLVSRKITPLLLASLILYFALLTGPLSNSARFRAPVEGFAIVLFVMGLSWFFCKIVRISHQLT